MLQYQFKSEPGKITFTLFRNFPFKLPDDQTLCSKVKQSRYTPWRGLGGEEVQLLLILDLGTRWG
jgi:hypothetical protein